MVPITSAEPLREALARSAPLGVIDGAFARCPGLRVYLGPCTLGQVCRWALSPAALRWRDGVAAHDPSAAARARLAATVWRDPEGTPLFEGEGRLLLDRLPAGVVDRLLHAVDRANGYLPPAPVEGGPADFAALLQCYAAAQARWLGGLLPHDPEAGLCVHPYDFATLAAAEEVARATIPGGGEVRLEVLSYPRLCAAVVRTGPEPGAPPLLDEPLARCLPYGAARSIVETADTLSEMGGPDAAVRFLDHALRPGLDGVGAVAAAPDRAVPERADRRPAG